jgi:hypothetical protein
MIKRIIMLVAFGLSFAQPALASIPPTTQVGEMKVSQHDGRSIVCSLANNEKRLPTEDVKPQAAKATAAGAIK